jgi:hypothetical protein
MRFIPFTKKIEVDAGYRAFYANERENYEIFVIDNGIKVIISNKGNPIDGLPTVKRYFKPILNLMTALEYAKSLGELDEIGYRSEGFALVTDPAIA